MIDDFEVIDHDDFDYDSSGFQQNFRGKGNPFM